jgi:hypothetical protein
MIRHRQAQPEDMIGMVVQDDRPVEPMAAKGHDRKWVFHVGMENHVLKLRSKASQAESAFDLGPRQPSQIDDRSSFAPYGFEKARGHRILFLVDQGHRMPFLCGRELDPSLHHPGMPTNGIHTRQDMQKGRGREPLGELNLVSFGDGEKPPFDHARAESARVMARGKTSGQLAQLDAFFLVALSCDPPF